jgi:GntR family transcriptional repressor for pyruvate dehydrogenase complex
MPARKPTVARRPAREGGDVASAAFAPELKVSLSDRLARRLRTMIRRGDYHVGDRLPPIMDMAKSFGVGHPTVREALKQLETIGMVEIRHGSGVYVIRSDEVLVLASPDYPGTVTKKLLLDLIRARMALEAQSVADAVQHATAEHLKEMRRLLTTAGQNLTRDDVLSSANMSFHRQIALASGNAVLVQLLDVLRELFSEEQQLILSIFGSRERDHQGHLAILDALRRRDARVGVERMRAHLKGVEDAILQWDPKHHPVG